MAQIRHIALRCRDAEKTRAFYELLGMRFVAYLPGSTGAMDLSDGTLNVTLIPYEGEERPVLEEGSEYIHLGVMVKDARETWRRLRDEGAPYLRDDVKLRNQVSDEEATPPGSFKVADPDGNVIDVTDNRDEWRGVRLDG